MKLLLTMPYEKYLFHVAKIFSCLGSRLVHRFRIFSEYMCNPNNSCPYFLLWVFSLHVLSIFFMAYYIILFLWFYAIMLPFVILAIPYKHFVFGFNQFSFLFVSPGLASLYVCCFPHIKNSMPFSLSEIENIKLEDIFPSVLKCFEIKPEKIMSVVPLLVQKRKACLVEFADTFILCLIIFVVDFIFLLFPSFMLTGSYF